MPKKPKRPCSWPGCPNLTDGLYCAEHEKQARDNYNHYERSPDVNRKYGRAWKRIRDRYAARHPLCERCLEEGLYPSWDAQNMASVRLAEKLGYEPDRAYTVYEVSNFQESNG